MNSFLNTVNNVITDGKNNGILHLDVADQILHGNMLHINGRELVNFSSCSYLGLEFDQRLKDGAIKAIEGYGTQFSASRAYLSSVHYSELEEKFNRIFDAHCVVAPTTTLGHIATIPVVVSDNDAVILDHQVHSSVQTAASLLKPKGIHVELVRHNRLDLLEEKIVELSKKHEKVWYMADGIYSMYGDGTPVEAIYELLNKYEKFHFYVDDAHGMSCYGLHGRGYVLQNHILHEKMILAISLAKAFATGGAVMVFPTAAQAANVRTCGGPMITSGPMQPAALGAALASADIHLSEEIKVMQTELHENIKFANLMIKKAGLPLVKNLNSPVFFVGVSLPKVGYQLIKRMMDDGYYTNLGAFPAVPMKNTGVRFTITRLHTFKQIEGMVESMYHHFDQALQDHNLSKEQIFKTFNLKPAEPRLKKSIVSEKPVSEKLLIETYDTIRSIDRNLWNSLFEGRGSFDYDGLVFLEETFSHNEMPEHNWQFDYLIIRERESGQVLLSTFFTATLCKDDMLSHYAVSEKIEEIRAAGDPYFLTSRVLMMGSLLTEGNHLFLNKDSQHISAALDELYKRAGDLMKHYKAASIMMRDFDDNNEELDALMLGNGYFKAQMPDRHVVSNCKWKDEEEFLSYFSKKGRKNIRTEILRYAHLFETEVIINPEKADIDHWKSLYKVVKKGSFKLNTFDLPEKLFDTIAAFPNWDVLSVKLNGQEVAVVFSYISGHTYNALFLGIDKSFDEEFSIYRQVLYSVLKRANALSCQLLNLGFSASTEKKKVGAQIVKTIAYVQSEDHFNASVIESIQVSKNQVIKSV